MFNKYYDQSMEDFQDIQKPCISMLVNPQNMDACKEQRKYAAQIVLLKIQMSLYEAGL